MTAACVATWVCVATQGCSFLFDIDTDQCRIDGDCQRIGLTQATCEAGICVTEAPSDTGGQGGVGGDEPSVGGEAGAGGADTAPECVDNAECIDSHFGQPYICREGKCIDLTTEECPLVVGTGNLKAKAPIIFGAYAVAKDAVSRSMVTRNIELAISEVTKKVTGLRGGPNGTPRTLAVVVCNSSYPDVAPGTIDPFVPSLDHLIDTVEVPGIISALSAKDLQAVFSQRLDQAGTFVISPYEQDSELASLSDGGRLWNLLGATSDVAGAFGPLLARTEAYLRTDDTFLNLNRSSGKLRVAVVTADIARETDVRDVLLELPELDAFDVKPFQVESAVLTADPDTATVADALLDYAPNIIVALAGSEFINDIIPVIETGSSWSTRSKYAGVSQQKPLYVLGAAMVAETWAVYSTKESETGTGYTTLMDRIVGVTYASATDTELLEAYTTRLIGANRDLEDSSLLLGTENVYDAAYLMIYAAAAAGAVPKLTGEEMSFGMRRLLAGTEYDIGPSAISSILTALETGDKIALRLTLGDAEWNEARGTRNGLGSVYCLNNTTSASLPRGPVYDALRYDPDSHSLEAKELPCITGF
jgi:hypothetical protein